MASPKSFVFVTLLSLKLGMIAALPAPVAVVYPAGNLRTFDSGNYELRWRYDSSQTEPKLYFRIKANTPGYVALAFPMGKNKLDVVVAGVDAAGNGYIKDLHQTVLGTLADDPTPNYKLESFSETTKTTQETVVEFSRSKSTSDTNDIQFLSGQGISVLWATGRTDTYTNLLQDPKIMKQTVRQITFVPN